MKESKIDNHILYNEKWEGWVDMKIYGPASRWLRSLISDQISFMNRGSVKSILDVGSGEGTITHFLAQKFPKASVLGVDFSESGIECARASYHLPNLSFKHDLDSRALAKKYDLVTAFEVLEHVEEWQDLLGRMADASKKYVLVSFPTGRMRPFERNVGHLRNFKKGEVEEFLATKGCKPVSVYYTGFPFYNPLYRELCQLTDSANNKFTQGKYGFAQKTIGWFFFVLFRFFSTRRRLGNQFCGLFERVA
jgi:SAM-dependent methyltransferase